MWNESIGFFAVVQEEFRYMSSTNRSNKIGSPSNKSIDVVFINIYWVLD